MELLAGLELHCESCGIAVPTDAPRLPGADCAFIALHRIAPTAAARKPETPAGQHAMGVGAWELIHDAPLKAGDAMGVAYRDRFKRERKAHFAESAVRQAMTPEQVAAALLHRRDRTLF